MTRSSIATSRAGILALSVGLLLLAVVGCSSAPASPSDEFRGTTLTAKSDATPFDLLNQFGNPTSLSDFRGKVVLLTFLYTNCPDVCPIVTNQLREAYETLGEDAGNTAFVAISVDPERDTVATAFDYSERWKMTNNWSYLVGTDAELAPVWKGYYLDPASLRPSSHIEATTAQESPPAGSTNKAGIDALVQESYLIIHSAPIYLIDGEGKMRVVYTQPFEIPDLINDVQTLLDLR